MKKALLLLFAAMLFLISCGGAELVDSPRITMVIMHETSVTVTWEVDTTIEYHEDFQGYNIYVSSDSSELLIQNGENLNKINPEVVEENSYEVRNLSQDTVYYFQVRTVNTEDKVGDYNDDVPFVAASPRPEFTVTLRWEVDAQTVDDSCAIRFSDAHITSDSAMADDDADMYIYYSGAPDDTVTLASPSTHPWYLLNARRTLFVNMGQYGFVDIYEITSEPATVVARVNVGDLVVAKTEDGNYVKIHIDAIDTNDNRVTITYAYQNIAGFPRF